MDQSDETRAIARNIEDILRRKGWTAADLVRAGGLNQSAVHDIMKARVRSPTLGTLAKIASGLGVELTDLLARSSDPDRRQTLVRIWESLPEADCDRLLVMAEALAERFARD